MLGSTDIANSPAALQDGGPNGIGPQGIRTGWLDADRREPEKEAKRS
jgi:hypothetical protein